MILAVETSCDETAVALFGDTLERELIASQVEAHRPYDGVVPEIAAREHLEVLPGLVRRIVSEANTDYRALSMVAVTRGPGLKGCLLVGSMFSHAFACALKIPCLGINHLEGHIFAPMLDCPALDFPFLSVLVSGGHSEIVIVRGLGDYEVVTSTIDDAAGEAFDKSASLIGLPYPGGPALARLADSVTSSPYRLPVVMRGRPEMSFSGLKTAVRTLVLKETTPEPQQADSVRTTAGYLTRQQQVELAHSIQQAIVDALIIKIEKALKETKIRTVALTGGVAANSLLRARIKSISGVNLFYPSIVHCTDNAAMIALVASLRRKAGLLPLGSSTQVLSRWPVTEISDCK